MKTHQQICTAILEEEDEIVEGHRRQIDETMRLVKEVCFEIHTFEDKKDWFELIAGMWGHTGNATVEEI
jgi:hypothetical protein